MGVVWNKRILCLLLALSLLLLAGCRVRTTVSGPYAGGEEGPGETLSAPGDSAVEAEETDPAEGDGSGERTRENPEASRKEYDETAPAEIVDGTDRPLHGEGEGDGAPMKNEDAPNRVSRLDDAAEETATQTVAAEEADQMGVSDDAEEADSALTYYTVLLQDRAGSLFECQRANVYWETKEDHVTVHKSYPEHGLILTAGAYDVSARLLAENLRVDDGWVVRKNPDVIVKVADSSVLGSGAASRAGAKSLCQSIMAREGWASIGAVRSQKIALISEELLDSPHGRTAAMLILAKTCDPSLFEDVDLDDALNQLTEEATGTLPTGVYYYLAAEK